MAKIVKYEDKEYIAISPQEHGAFNTYKYKEEYIQRFPISKQKRFISILQENKWLNSDDVQEHIEEIAEELGVIHPNQLLAFLSMYNTLYDIRTGKEKSMKGKSQKKAVRAVCLDDDTVLHFDSNRATADYFKTSGSVITVCIQSNGTVTDKATNKRYFLEYIQD